MVSRGNPPTSQVMLTIYVVLWWLLFTFPESKMIIATYFFNLSASYWINKIIRKEWSFINLSKLTHHFIFRNTRQLRIMTYVILFYNLLIRLLRWILFILMQTENSIYFTMWLYYYLGIFHKNLNMVISLYCKTVSNNIIIFYK